MAELWQDVRYALRAIATSPAVTLISVLALAIGIGANTAIFSVVDAILLRPLPFPASDRLYRLEQSYPQGGRNDSGTVPDFIDFRKQSRSFATLSAYFDLEAGYNLAGNGLPERLTGIQVTADFFDTLGVHAALGRVFMPGEDQRGHSNVVVLSHALWLRRFGSGAPAIGATLTLNDQPYTIVGVMPAGFRYVPMPDLWVPMVLEDVSQDRSAIMIAALRRLRPGVSQAAAQSEMTVIARRLEQAYPKSNRDRGAAIVPLQEFITADLRTPLLVLLCGVGLVLLIACVDAANLLLAKAATREKEIAIRSALGAGRSRIMRQLLTESTLMAAGAAALGVLLAYWMVRLLLRLAPPGLPQMNQIGLNGWVLGFTLGISMLTGLLFGLAPALQASRPNFNDTLKQASGRSSTSRQRRRVRSALVISEIALALVLLVSAGLLIASFARLNRIDAGFNPRHLLTMHLSLSEAKFNSTEKLANYYRSILPRVASVPGVESTGLLSSLPLETTPSLPYIVVGRPLPARNDDVPAGTYHAISPGVFRAMGIPVLRGRDFAASDSAHSAPVVIISERAARTWWPHDDPIGKQIWIGKPFMGPEFTDTAPRQIVGVVGDVHYDGLERQPREAMYVPFPQVPEHLTSLIVRLLPLGLAVRTHGDPLAVTEAVKREIWSVAPEQPLADVRSMEQLEHATLAPRQFNMTLLALFAGVALLLAAIGIYGVMAYSVTQRSHEIGIRMALGASGHHVRRLIIGDALRLAAIGILIGAAGSFALTRAMASLLYGVKAWDPRVFTAVAVLLAAVALLASYLPARRASALDPVVELR